ncbi:Putative TetR family transcriptional regulator (plasmid) [Sodalis praecaptivus]|uniref:Putative TetR family transcriptional regulator n=1 Tax=Sodalis praecaptivus TaxID=1239307 RepID=W0I2S3_9GAMM|nr:TetR/AcrR family transcriptional regulator [Sodalis praecaptivus]AHF79052.1 Putative TetR family transcriptional regulator [Sodalis praecaptivus]
MGRNKTIDQEALLDAAEAVVMRGGAGNLTFDAVARQAGVSKGGVLYAFATKDALIDAMLRRVVANYDRILEDFLAMRGDSPETRIHAYVEANRKEDAEVITRAVALMASFMRAPAFQAETNTFYKDLFAMFDITNLAGRRLRLALLATEGAFALRGFKFYAFSDREWQAIHDDIINILLS